MPKKIITTRRDLIIGATATMVVGKADAATIITRGAMSAQAFGFGSVSAPSDGTFAIFTKGCCSTTTSKYTFACNTSVSGPSASTSIECAGAASGNATSGIFAKGYIVVGCSPVPQTATTKYNFTCNSFSTGPTLAHGIARGTATGNKTKAIFSNGVFTCRSQTSKITYACNTFSAGPCLNSTSSAGSRQSASSPTKAYIAIGQCSKTTNKYTYACATIATGHNLTNFLRGSGTGGAVGNACLGIFMYICTATATTKYCYAGCTTASGTSLHCTINNNWIAAGNSINGVITSCNNKTSTYKFACGTVAAGGAMSPTTYVNGSAASNGIKGVTI